MKILDQIDVMFSALERRKEVIKESPAVAKCDVCDENPGERTIFFAGVETWACEDCIEDCAPPRRRFRNRDEHEAFEAGVPSRGEI